MKIRLPKPRLIDTHAHLYLKEFKSDRATVIDRAQQGLAAVLLPNIDLDTIGPMHQLADSWPDFCYPMMGLHPCSVKADYRQVLDRMRPHFEQRAYVAVGETGIDLYWDKSTLAWQQDSLAAHAEWAKELDLPIVLHARDAFDETAEVIESAQDGRLRGVFHCFAGTKAEAIRALDLGFYLGIGGVITYRKCDLRDILPALPEDRLVVETDSPYLAPVPYRGKRNESSYVRLVAEEMGRSLGIPTDEVVELTTDNARRLFFPKNGQR